MELQHPHQRARIEGGCDALAALLRIELAAVLRLAAIVVGFAARPRAGHRRSVRCYCER